MNAEPPCSRADKRLIDRVIETNVLRLGLSEFKFNICRGIKTGVGEFSSTLIGDIVLPDRRLQLREV